MRAVPVLLLLAIAFFAAAIAHGPASAEDKAAAEEAFNPPNSNVTNLDEKNFDEFVAANEYVLIEFYAPWCPHCKKLVADYEKAASLLKGKVAVAKVDCDKAKEMAQKFGVPGFPTIKLFKGGKPFRDFEEPDRSGEGMAKWVEKKTGPSSTTVTVAGVEEFVKKAAETASGAIVIGYFSTQDCDEYKTFRNASDSLDEFVFGEVIDESITKPSVSLFKTHQSEENLKTESFSDLQTFIKSNGYAAVDEINAKTFQRYASAGMPLGVYFFDYKKPEEKTKAFSVLKKAAEALKGKFNFGYSDGNVYGEQLNIMGGNKDKLPGLAAMNLESRKNYPYTGEMTADAILEWANGILEGKIEPFLKSEPIPEKNDDPVKIVVGKNYESLVLNKEKDVLLEFYAPWCGHCQKLTPKYEELAKFFSSIDNLVIAKVDATQNDTPMNIEGFPTIYYFPADAKEDPVLYEGNRSVTDLKKFIKKNASASIKKAVKDLLKGGDKKEESKKDDKEAKKPKDEL